MKVLILILSLVSYSALAQLPNLPLPEDLVQWQQQALDRNPDLQAKQQAVLQAQKQVQVQQGKQGAKVVLKSELGVASMKQDFSRTANQLVVTYPLYAPHLSEQEKAAEAATQVRHWQQQAAAKRLALQVGLNFVQLLKQQEQVRFTERQLRAMQDIKQQLQARYQVGMTQLNDIAEVASRIALMQSSQLQAKQQVQTFWQKLVAQSNGSFEQTFDPKQLPLATPQSIQQNEQQLKKFLKFCQNSQSCQHESLNQHPEIQALQQQLVQLQRQQQAVKHRYGAKLNAVGALVYNNSGGRYYDDMQGAKAALQLEVPLYQAGEDQAATAAVQVQTQAVRLQIQQTRLNLQQQWETAVSGLRSLSEQLPALQSAVQAAQQALKATEAGLRTGERTILDVLNAQKDLDQRVKNLNIAQYEVWRYALNLKYLIG